MKTLICPTILSLLLISPVFSKDIQFLKSGRGPASSQFNPTIETCELLENDSYMKNLDHFESVLLNESTHFCVNHLRIKEELEVIPCKVADIYYGPSYNFSSYPKFFNSFASVVERHLLSQKFPVPKTTKPLPLSDIQLKALSYLCTKTIIEKAEHQLITLERIEKVSEAKDIIKNLAEKGLFSFFFQPTNSSVGTEILALNKYPESFKQEVFFLYLEKASEDEINQDMIKYTFDGFKWAIENDTERRSTLKLYELHQLQSAEKAAELIEKYKQQPPELKNPKVLEFLEEVGF